MSNVNEAVVNYLAAWNERDPAKRQAAVARAWDEQGSYRDGHREGVGHAAIAEMIAKVHGAFDPNYRFRLVSKIEAHDGHVRFSWQAGGTPEAPLFFAGTDFCSVGADGRLNQVIGFTDAAPAPAQ